MRPARGALRTAGEPACTADPGAGSVLLELIFPAWCMDWDDLNCELLLTCHSPHMPFFFLSRKVIQHRCGRTRAGSLYTEAQADAEAPSAS